MTDQLLTELRRHADAEAVPDLDLGSVVRRGRRVTRRRTAVRSSIAGLALACAVGGAVVVGQPGPDGPRLEVSTSLGSDDVRLVSDAYRTGGAFSRGTTLWFADPDYSVDLGVTIQLMYYTADGVIAGVTNDDAGDAPRRYVYVGTDGTVRELDLPRKVVPGADALADRFAYVTEKGSGYEIHVAEASTGDELATVPFDAPYNWAGWDVPPIGLTGDFVVLGVDGAQQVVDWRTGERVADVPGSQLPSTGGGRALGGDLGDSTYALGDSAKLRSTSDLTVTVGGFGAGDDSFEWASNELSPDGRFVLTTNTMIEMNEAGELVRVTDASGDKTIPDPVVHVTDVDTGQRITLPGHNRTYGWTPDGRLIRVEGTTVTTCGASTGACENRQVPGGDGKIRMAGRYLGS